MEGFYLSDTDYTMSMDCDFQHPVSAIGDLIAEMDKGADVCVGVRNSRMSMGRKRALGSSAVENFNKLFFRLHGKQTTKDFMSGLFALRCEVFRPVIAGCWDRFEYKGWKVLMDLMKYSDRRVKVSYIRYDFGVRTEGVSHISPKVPIMTFHQLWWFGKVMAKFFCRYYHVDYYEMYPAERKH